MRGKSRFSFRARACLFACVWLWISAAGPGCTFGDQQDASAEATAELQYLLASFQSSLTALPRFGDGGTDRLDQFTANGIAVVLSTGTFLDIERIEVVITPATPFSQLTGSQLNGDFRTLQQKHEEGTATADGDITVVLGRDIFVEPLSASTSGGIFGTGRDSLNRYYFESSALVGPITAGTITRVTIHLRRFQFTGTLNGTAFTALYTATSDVSTTVSCGASLRAGASVSLNLFMDYSILFTNLAAATSSSALTAFAANLSNGDLLKEHECFTL